MTTVKINRYLSLGIVYVNDELIDMKSKATEILTNAYKDFYNSKKKVAAAVNRDKDDMSKVISTYLTFNLEFSKRLIKDYNDGDYRIMLLED